MPHWLNVWLSGICHQYPDHALIIHGEPLPLCARCTGLFGGALLTWIALTAWGRGRRGAWAPWWAQGVLAALATWWALDGLNAFLFDILGRPWLYEPTNALRLATGLGMGVSIALTLAPLAAQYLFQAPEAGPPISKPQELGLLLAITAAWGLLWWRGNIPYMIAALWPILGVGSLLSIANALLLVLAIAPTRDSPTPRFILGGIALSFVEPLVVAFVRQLLG
jgi:uncharacterized membrane protein